MKSIKIYFCDFWNNFNPKTDLIYKLLSLHYNVELAEIYDKDVDLVIYSGFGDIHLSIYGVKKLYYSGENDFPNFQQCDYAITHNSFEFERHIRIPLWLFYHEKSYTEIFKNSANLDNSAFNRKFCADVISNNTNSWPVRLKMIDYISANYKQIDHGGMINNNVGGPVKDKIEFLNNYKFSIAAENSSVNGYITEKIYESFIANTIPIYLGNAEVVKDFNSDSFINVSDYPTYPKLLSRIAEIDSNEDLYMEMINQPRLASNDLIEQLYSKLESFLINIIENGRIYNHTYGRIGFLNYMWYYF